MDFDKGLVEQAISRANEAHSSLRFKIILAIIVFFATGLWCWIHMTTPRYQYELRSSSAMSALLWCLLLFDVALFFYLFSRAEYLSFRAFLRWNAHRAPDSFYAYVQNFYLQQDAEQSEKLRTARDIKAHADGEFESAVKNALKTHGADTRE